MTPTRYALALALALAACLAIAGCGGPQPAADAPAARTRLPAKFVADRVVLVPTTASGQVLELMTDSGGGSDQLSEAAVARLRLPTEPADIPGLREELGEAADGTRLARFPAFAEGQGIPDVRFLDGRLMVFPEAFVRQQTPPGLTRYDGFLGHRWFADRTWTWDYAGEAFYREPAAFQPDPDARAMPLGFLTSALGKRVFSMPRMTVRVDGRELPMLLDTGATTVLTPEALAVLGDGGPAERATSMVADNVFRAWRAAHPEWRVIEGGQAFSGADMIEVPEVEIAGFTVGPVWFTHRPDANFHDMMSSMMDAQVEGAIGGNAFRHFVMTVDYPAAVAYFRPARTPGQP